MSWISKLSRQQKKKVVWANVAPFLEIPNSATIAGQRAYRAAQRQIESKLDDANFMREFERQRQSFRAFLLTHDLEPYPPLQSFLNRDFSDFFNEQKKPQHKRR